MATDALPITLTPAPGEAIDGYLERLAAHNGYSNPAFINALVDRSEPAILTIAPGPRLLDRLGQLSDQSPSCLHAATLGALPGIATVGDEDAAQGAVRVWRRTAAQGWPPEHGTAICPRCLAADGIWRIAWRHPWVTTCLTHGSWLVATCPTCKERFRSGRTTLRSVDADIETCGNPGGARGRSCPQRLHDVPVERAPDHVLNAARRIDAALNARAIDVLGESLPPSIYLADLRALTVLLLHLAAQMGGEQHTPWADRARTDRARSSGDRGARWGLAPPANLQLRGEALAAADEILRAASLDDAADRLHPWTELTPHTPDGQLGWLADHTTMTALLSSLILAATASRRRLATLLDASPVALPMTAIPQVIPADLYTRHFGGMLDVADRTGRLFVALCMARQQLGRTSWAEAAAALRLPVELGTKTARACSADLLAPAREFIAALARTADDLDPTVDYRAREDAVRRLARHRGWYRPWAREHLPGSHATSQQYAVTWLWTEYARGHIDTSPGWQHPMDRQDRAHFRAYAGRLDPAATEALTGLVQGTTAGKRRAA
jgi:hypothetical protein